MNSKNKADLPMRMFIISTAFVVAYLAYSYAYKVYQDYEIQKQIDVSKEEIANLRKENEQMTDYINYLRSDIFKEKKAKQILNLKNDGEVVVVFEDNGEEFTTYSNTSKKEYLSTLSNKDKWWEYFFGDLSLQYQKKRNRITFKRQI